VFGGTIRRGPLLAEHSTRKITLALHTKFAASSVLPVPL